MRSLFPNKDIDFGNLFKQVDRRIDVIWRVGNHEGIDDAATYANTGCQKQVFAENVVDPLLLRNYTQLTLRVKPNYWRYGHSYYPQFAIPGSSTRSKVQAEADDIRINSILK